MSRVEPSNDSDQKVYVVDDDSSARESLCWLLNTEGIETRAFASAEALLAEYSSDWSGCITVDIRMPGRSGLQLQEALNARHNRMPVIVLTGHADVPIAIRAMKLGAHDFLEKPYTDSELLVSIRSALARGREIDDAEHARETAASALQSLSEREAEVMQLIVAGHTNKTAAAELGISDKTVEVHRARVMEKTGARSLSELVRMSLIMQEKI